jgi:hypothetical protein
MQRKPIFMGVHGDRANPQLVGGTKNPDGNFAAVGGEQLVDRSDLRH